MNCKIAHSYNKEFKSDFGQVKDVIVIESTELGNFELYSKRDICSFVGEMMINNGQIGIAKENNQMLFEVLALDPTRTTCEKIVSLVRFSYSKHFFLF